MRGYVAGGEDGGDMSRPFTDEQIDSLLYAISHISCGGSSGPRGFEALTMAIGGEGQPGSNGSVRESISEIASAIHDLADAVRYHADSTGAVIQ